MHDFSQNRAVASLSATQRAILERAIEERSVASATPEEEVACTQLWRSGLLRMNGEPGYQISRLGVEALKRRGHPSQPVRRSRHPDRRS